MAKLTIKKMWKQFNVINRHKWEVFKICYRAGHPIMGIMHDLSKYSPIEFLELSKFQTDGSSPIWAARKEQGYSKAWQHHKGHNPHHWEYWTAGYRTNRTLPIKMPFRYVVEMFCDYMGAGRAYAKNGGPEWTTTSAYEYWMKLKEISVMHPETQALMDEWYENLITLGLNNTLNLIKINKNYEIKYEHNYYLLKVKEN